MEGKQGESGVVLVREQSIHAENFELNERTFASPRFYQYFVIPSRLEVFKSTPLHMSLFGHIHEAPGVGRDRKTVQKCRPTRCRVCIRIVYMLCAIAML